MVGVYVRIAAWEKTGMDLLDERKTLLVDFKARVEEKTTVGCAKWTVGMYLSS